MTHREMCREAARWLLSERGLFASAYEVGFDGGQADALGVSEPDPCAGIELRIGEYARTRAIRHAKMEKRLAKRRGDDIGPVFANAMILPNETQDEVTRTRRAKAAPPPAVAVIECKRSRSDWLNDANERKFTRYEPASSECWLFITADVVQVPEATPERILLRLRFDGLPDHWGVLMAGPSGRALPIRAATPHRGIADWEVVGWAGRMLRSMSYRVLTGSSPMADEAEAASK